MSLSQPSAQPDCTELAIIPSHRKSHLILQGQRRAGTALKLIRPEEPGILNFIEEYWWLQSFFKENFNRQRNTVTASWQLNYSVSLDVVGVGTQVNNQGVSL